MQLAPQKAADMVAAVLGLTLTCAMCLYSPVSGNRAYTVVTCSTAPVPTVASTASIRSCRLDCP
eukprot:6156900-Pyramimonas_sp.AAC.1